MRLPFALALVVVAPGFGSIAAAGPITAGVSFGLAESKADAAPDVDASHTLGLYGRLRFTSRLSGQLEAYRIETGDQSTDIRSGSALLVVDLGARGRLVPILLAGAGLDRASTSYSTATGHHFEGGLGLEYRADGGLTIGIDARMGGRSIDSTSQQYYPLGAIALIAPSTLRDGEYRAVRASVGVRF